MTAFDPIAYTKKRSKTVLPYDTLQIKFEGSNRFVAYLAIREFEIKDAIAKVKLGWHVINLDGVKAIFRIVRDDKVVMKERE